MHTITIIIMQYKNPVCRPIKMYCDCGKESTFFMTNEEIFGETLVHQYCDICKRTTKCHQQNVSVGNVKRTATAGNVGNALNQEV